MLGELVSSTPAGGDTKPVAVITGASSGIGRVTARVLAEQVLGSGPK